MEKTKNKTPKQLERYMKGVANHRRIQILQIISENQGLNLEDISELTKCNIKTISEHTLRLFRAGLIEKKYVKTSVAHSLSPYGKKFIDFIKSFN